MIGVVIGTYGDESWAMRGAALADTIAVPDVHVVSSHGSTLAVARNVGAAWLPRDDTRWLCFLDADDELEHDFLFAMLHRIYELDRVYARVDYRALLMPAVRYVHEDGRQDLMPTIPNGSPRRPLWEINRGVIGTLIDARTFFDLHGFRELPIYEDWDLWLRAVASGARVHEVLDAVYRVNFNPAGRNRARDVDSTYWTIRKEHER